MGRRSERVPRAAASMMATGEPSHTATVAAAAGGCGGGSRAGAGYPRSHQGHGRARTESHGAGGRGAAEAPVGGDSAARGGRSRGVVGSAPRPAPGVLVVRSDGCVMSQQLAPDAGASTSRAAAPALDAISPRWEQGLRHPGVPQGLLDEARSERALWQEFRAPNASLSATLTEALWLHGGRSLQIFQVRMLVRWSLVFSLLLAQASFVLILFSTLSLLFAGAAGPGGREVQSPRRAEL
jgi:hypothetical protein